MLFSVFDRLGNDNGNYDIYNDIYIYMILITFDNYIIIHIIYIDIFRSGRLVLTAISHFSTGSGLFA